DGQSGSAPFVDANYGAFPNIHLHVLTPMLFSRPEGGPTTYGYGDTEFGAKIRFLEETDWRPQMAVYPAMDVPTGNADRGLGSGKSQTFLPLWLQKTWGPWAFYGGAGWWYNPGQGRKNWVYTGWVLQRDLSRKVTVGG